MKEIRIQLTDDEAAKLLVFSSRNGQTLEFTAAMAVRAVAAELGRTFPSMVAELHAQRLSTSEIAARLGVVNQRVSKTLRRLQLTPWPRRYVAPAKPSNPRARSVA